MIRKRYGYWIVCWLVSLVSGYAQTTTYPLQVNANVVAPYSLYLSDYYSGTRDRLAITLINRDQLTPTVNVRLRMTITAAGGIRIQTNETSFIQPIIVEAGVPVRLTQEDLAPYFQPDNIITQGFLSAGKMPEGMVEFCFQAVEAYTGRVLSTSTCTRAWITSQKPPLLSLPRNEESIGFREPLNVLFQWTPLHQGLAQVEYDFILKELWDNGMTPQAAFPYSPEIYRETTRSTSVVYGAMQPPLLPGKRYAWCVQAKARDGMEELNVFQNNGYSEIRWFKLQDNCQPLELVEATAERKRVNLTWTPLPEHIGFTINYREKSSGEQQNEWKEQSTQQPQTTLYGMKAGAIYEYRVGSICMSGQPIYTAIMEVLVPAADSARTAQCGIMPAVNLQNQELIGELKPQEVFQVGDFPVTVVRCSGGKGSLTGVGWTIIPWLNDAKVAVEFDNIGVNTDRQMTTGMVRAIYDEKAGQIANLDDAFVGGYDQGLVKTGLTKTDTTFDFSIPGVESFALGDDGSVIITDATGEPHSIAMSDREGEGNEGNKVKVFPMTVKDKDGNVYQVEKVTEMENGVEKETVKATKLGNIGPPLSADSFDPTQINVDKAIVRFNKGTGKYSFDTWQSYYANILLIRDKYEKLHNDYYAAWKLLPGGENDDVGATIEIVDKAIDPKKVIFTTPQGTRYDAVHDNGKYTLRVTAGPEGDVQELYALYPKGDGKYYTLGKLGIATYAKQEREVVLVSVENTHVDYDKVEQMLKSVYDSVGIHWTISRDAFAYDATGLMADATGLSTYNDAMRALNNAYRAARPGFKPSANYVFFLKATGNTDINKRDLTGFMPRGAQFGYIFTSEVANADEPITVAHELGHGRWKLYHPFDKTYGGFETAKKTNNLMAYGNGGHIAKWQWDQLADPAAVVSVFESDDRSEQAVAQENPITAKILAKVKEVYEASGKNVVALIYCKECKNPVKTLVSRELPGGNITVIQAGGKACLGLVFKVNGEDVELIEREMKAGPTSSDNAWDFGMVLPALADKEKQTLGIYDASKKYGKCTQYLNENFFNRFDYCTQAPTESLYDQLLTAVAECVKVETIGIGDGAPVNRKAIVSDDVRRGVEETLAKRLGNERIRVRFVDEEGEDWIGEEENPTLELAYEKDPTTGRWNPKARFKEAYVQELAALPNMKKFGALSKIMDDLAKSLDDVMEDAQVTLVPCSDNGIGVDCISDELNLLQVISLNLDNIAREGVINEAMWHSTQGERDLLPKNAQWLPASGGVVDELVDEAVGVFTVVKTLGEVYLHEEKRAAVQHLFTEDGMKEMIAKSIMEWVGADSEQLQYKSSRAVVMMAFFYYAWAESAAKNIDDALQEAEKLSKQLDNAPTLQRQMSEIAALGDQGVGRTKQIKELVDKFGAGKLEGIVRWVGDDQVKTLLEDLASSKTLQGAFVETPGLAESWKIIKGVSLSDALRKNLSNLESLSNALKQPGYAAAYFDNLLKSKPDLQNFFDTYVSKLGRDGKFVDGTLETDYQSYVSRKAKEGKSPRDRADWNEASDHMKYDSPTARGNRFNEIGREKYDINELNLKLADGSNVRVDSYIKASDSPTGEGMIISRKATDLVDIQESTFRKHLQEMKNKYAPGTLIRSDKYPKLDGGTIQGRQYLEIPESNKSFYDIERYKKIAKEEYSIEIIFLAE
jgi:hypothetical protein